MSEFWEEYHLIGEVTKNKRGEIIRVARAKKNGKWFIDIRTYYTDDADELAPGKGIAIPCEDGKALAVGTLIHKAIEGA